MKALMTFWLSTPEPDVSSSSGVITTLDNLTRPLVAFAAVLGLVVGGVRMAWTARAEQSGQSILRGLLLMTIVTGAGATIVVVMLTGFDLLGKSILDNGFDGRSVGERLAALGSLPSVGGGLVFVLAFFGILASLAQVGIMLVRGAILAVLVGTLPVAAASSITEAGYAWFKRLCGWIFSYVLYKLVAAIIYAAAFTMTGDGKDLAGVVSGFSLLIVAILALPALLRLLPPAAEAMGGGSGGAMAGLVAAAATGAVSLSGKSGGGSSSPAPTASPGLKGEGGPSGSSGTTGKSAGTQALPSGGKSASGAAQAGASGAGAGAGAGAAAGGSATAGGAAGAGPVGAGVAVAQKVHSGAKAAASGAVGEGGSQ